MEWLNSLPVVQQAVVWVLAVNAMLFGLKQGLDMIKDKTATMADNKAAEIVGKICGWIAKILDVLGMNPRH